MISADADCKNKHENVSDCCGKPTAELSSVVEKVEPGITSYYRKRCTWCGNPCHTIVSRIWDSNGVEIKAGDIIECPSCAPYHAERYHACYWDARSNGLYELSIRDLGNNNVHMYQSWGDYFNIGHYSKHLDKLSDEDLSYYWGTTRFQVEAVSNWTPTTEQFMPYDPIGLWWVTLEHNEDGERVVDIHNLSQREVDSQRWNLRSEMYKPVAWMKCEVPLPYNDDETND